MSSNTPGQSTPQSSDRPSVQAPISTAAEYADDIFFDVPLNEDQVLQPQTGIEKKNPKDLPFAVNDFDVFMPRVFGILRLETQRKIGSFSDKAVFSREDLIDEKLPDSALNVMEEITNVNAQPLYPGSRHFLLHKIKGFPPTMKELTPTEALLELSRGNHVKITLAQVKPVIESGKRDRVITQGLADWTYRIDTLDALNHWWNSIGWPFRLGSLRGHPSF